MKKSITRSVGTTVLAVLTALALNVPLQAQVPDAFQPVINHSVGLIYAHVRYFAVQPDGKVILGGDFTELNGAPMKHLGRVNPDGSLDATFQSSIQHNGLVMLALQHDGRFIAASDAQDPVARYLPNGSPDPNYPAGVSDGNILGMAAFPDGRIAFANQTAPGGGSIRQVDANGVKLFDAVIQGVGVTLAAQPDGKLLVGGSFSALSGQARTTLARLNTNGTLDDTFNPNVTGTVGAIALQPDASILIAGNLVIEGQPRKLARLTPSGQLDTNFNASFSGAVRSIALQADGKIIVGGSVSGCTGGSCLNVARFESDGTFDASFAPIPNELVYGITIQPDGKVLIGGSFTNVESQPRTKVARLLNTEPATETLTADNTSITWLRGGTSPEVWTTTFESSTNGGLEWSLLGVGQSIPGGWQVSGVTIPANANVRARGFVTGGYANSSSWFVERIIGPPSIFSHPVSRTNDAPTEAKFAVAAIGSPLLQYQWRKDGADLTDGVNISGSQTATLTVLHSLHSDEGLYDVVVSNSFNSVTSKVATLTVNDPAITNRSTVSGVNVGGSLDLRVEAAGTPQFSYEWRHNGTVVPGATGALLTIQPAQFSDAGEYRVTVGNAFGNATATFHVTVNAALADSFNPEMTLEAPPGIPSVRALAVQTDDRIVVGGSFSTVSGGLSPGLARLNPDGGFDASLTSGLDNSSQVNSEIVLPDGKILAASYWPPPFIFRYLPSGSADPSLVVPPDVYANQLVRKPDGTVFISVQAGPTSQIRRMKPDGTFDDTFALDVYEIISSLAVQSDGKVLVGGLVYQIGNETVAGLGRLNTNGTPDEAFHPAFLLDGDWTQAWIDAVAVQEDGRIIVTGIFNELAGQPCEGIGRLNPDGTADPTFNAALPYRDFGNVQTIALQADGKILLGGSFTSLNGQPVARIGRLNHDGSLDSTFSPSVDGSVFGLTLEPDGRVLVGGDFSLLAGQARQGLGRLVNTAPAMQTLSYDGSTVKWLRGGTSPAVWTVLFENSTDGTNWTSLGAGTHIDGGWQLTGVTAAVGTKLRARGWVASGFANASGWITESVISVPMQLLTGSLQTQPFGFSLFGPVGQSVVIEGSTDLQNWIPLKTNTVPGDGLVTFTDPESATHLHRFYRGRVQ